MPQDSESDVFLASQRSDIYVMPKPETADEFLVVPGTFGVPEDGKKIWIRNVTGRPVEVTFPGSVGSGSPVAIADGTTKQFTLKPATVGIYVYRVDVDLAGMKVPAQGGSNPRIVYG